MGETFQKFASRCMLCQSEQLEPIIQIPQVPVFCNVLWLTREEAIAASRGDIYLVHCRNCDHIYNTAFDPALVDYHRGYENSLFFSGVYRAYVQETAQILVDRYDIHRKEIIEIGCGQGDFLRLLCALGCNRGLGFDPSLTLNLPDTGEDCQLSFIAEPYSERHAHIPASMVSASHVLEHLENPVGMLNTVKRTIWAQSGAIIFIEVPNAQYAFERLGIWDIIYEHPSYFSLVSLHWLFDHCGYLVLELHRAYADQYLVAVASLQTGEDDQMGVDMHLQSEALHIPDHYTEMFHRKIEGWQAYVAHLSKHGSRVVVWGAGSKGVTFLNLLGDSSLVEYVVDINPGKVGKYIPGGGQRVISPEFLRDYQPDIIIVMNPVYQVEISRQLAQLEVQAKLMNV
jgi:trans-aconitate methyltransferase